MTDIAVLKAHIDFRVLVAESHEVGVNGKIACPFHDERHPSCHIYRDGFKCFGCGIYGDHLDWLKLIYGMTTAEAIAALRERAGQVAYEPPRSKRRRDSAETPPEPLTERELTSYRQRLKRLKRLPDALADRGLTVEDARRLNIAALGDDALLPITDPAGRVVALKRRFHRPQGGQRYSYTTAGHGSPAWCSPRFDEAETVLVVEGELNGMVSWLALDEQGVRVAVMAPAGAQGRLYPEALTDRRVFIYADADPAGERARARWAAAARRAGARSVTLLAPFNEDACELAGRYGRAHLARRWRAALLAARPAAAAPPARGVGGWPAH